METGMKFTFVLLLLHSILSCETALLGFEDCLRHKSSSSSNKIKIGFLSRYKSSKVILGALPLAVDYVNARSDLLPGKLLEYYAVNIGTDEAVISTSSIRNMTELMLKEGVIAFIGPDETCLHEALVASAWNLPLISYSCADIKLTNKTLFPTFARTSLGPPEKISKSVIALLKAYNWKKFIIVADSSNWMKEITLAVRDLANRNDLNVTDIKFYSDYLHSKIQEMKAIVMDTYKRTRIYVFVGAQYAINDFMVCMQEEKLFDKGEYMVISVNDEFYNPDYKISNEMRPTYPLSSHPSLFPKNNKDKTLNIKSYQSILQITLTAPSVNLTSFYRDIHEKATEKFKIPSHSKIAPVVPIRAAYLYDAVIIYARAATKVLNEHGDLRDGQNLMQKYVFNNKFTSKQGFQVFIDENGNAEGNFSVFSMQSNNSTKTMQQVGLFVSTPAQELPVFQQSKPIMWVNGKPPKDEPICGFDGCPTDWSFIVSCMFVILFVGLVSFFLIKQYDYEQKLQSILWKVDLREVTFLGNEYNGEEAFRIGNIQQFFRHRTMSIIGGESSRRAYTSIGFYRGNFVAMKKVYKRSIDLTRSIKKELKLMRELRHENIVGFVGVSIDTANIFIFTNYCARGSLENVLANEDLKLDNMFISSLVFDIIKGLIFLHDSEIVSHGNLRTSNCLIDSRWCVKISDFGLDEFRHGNDELDKDQKDIKRCLTRAPELLRMDSPPAYGTQKGDVYSFGILLYEIYGRRGPFGLGLNCDFHLLSSTFKEIIEKITNPMNPLRVKRPPIHVIDYAPECVKSSVALCWHENPDERPDMRLIRIKLKELQGGLKSNIFDNMMALMEKYAFNLEELVQDRTLQLSEEKKKTENLLLRMLPKSVAESLIRGERVQAEFYDCVTIMFSDLVGFTEICSQSSPLEVVEMLNDLYSLMDSIISNFDCYKVETIGDAYLVVSGLPVRNIDHASQIASLALMILQRIVKLEIRHRPGELFQIRIGIHSGSVVAGVVGCKMPRYCLFGDTVNCSSRMESTSEARRIHISNATYMLLAKDGGYVCEERGMTFIKGKGDMKTYWLKGEDSSKKKRFVNNSSTVDKNLTPDLLCIYNNNSRASSTTSKSTLSENKLFALHVNDSLSVRGDPGEDNIVITPPTNDVTCPQRCYLCQKKKYLFMKYHRELHHHCRKFDSMLNCHQVETTSFMSSLSVGIEDELSMLGDGKCTCQRSCDETSLLPIIRTLRTPSSAPQITFME